MNRKSQWSKVWKSRNACTFFIWFHFLHNFKKHFLRHWFCKRFQIKKIFREIIENEKVTKVCTMYKKIKVYHFKWTDWTEPKFFQWSWIQAKHLREVERFQQFFGNVFASINIAEKSFWFNLFPWNNAVWSLYTLSTL